MRFLATTAGMSASFLAKVGIDRVAGRGLGLSALRLQHQAHQIRAGLWELGISCRGGLLLACTLPKGSPPPCPQTLQTAWPLSGAEICGSTNQPAHCSWQHHLACFEQCFISFGGTKPWVGKAPCLPISRRLNNTFASDTGLIADTGLKGLQRSAEYRHTHGSLSLHPFRPCYPACI